MRHAPRFPDDSAWSHIDSIAAQNLRRLFYGKTIAEVQQYFGSERSRLRMNELLAAPRPIFQYYVHAFSRFLMSERAAGDAESADAFLSLLEERENHDSGSVRAIYLMLENALSFVSTNQHRFGAPVEAYGDFKKRAGRIKSICDA